jgi:signal transduction histidine kinase
VPEVLDPLELANSVLARVRKRFPSREVDLVSPAPVPAVRADPLKLCQVLENLLENAIKYSPPETFVELQVESEAHHVRFAIRDEGPGIPNEELRRIFAKFYRLDPQLTNGVGGTGLGLYICRELVRRMDGRISVSSELGVGSTFTVDIPAATAEPTAAWPAPTAGSAAGDVVPGS